MVRMRSLGTACLFGSLLAAGLAAAAVETVPAALPGARPFPGALRATLARELAAQGRDYEPRTRHRRPDGSPIYTNRLLLEASPYLRQHAHNPVNWYSWGDEAFETARRLGRPVLVSIGYSTCHWCHVMEEESFDDTEIARLLNAQFVAVKVDRELRPDIDAVYMSAIHAMNGRGGWPLNVWVTPDRKPFYAGTYFPPRDRAGRLGLPTVLRRIHESWSADPERVGALSERLAAHVREDLEAADADATRIAGPESMRRAQAMYARRFDDEWGGVGRNQKFPYSLPIRLLLRYHRRSGDLEALRMASLSLEKIAAGGIRDHVGGGFHRYATDRRWLVPHFEKMLYDNALLAMDYVEAWQVTGREDFAAVAREILRYVDRELTAPGGGFYSATDADSLAPGGEREEGRFFTWTPGEIEAVLGQPEAAAVIAYYGVTPGGHLDGRSVLHSWRDPAQVAAELGTTQARLLATLERARPRLYGARLQRSAPLRDEKILAGWNGLMISALARSAFALGEPAYAGAAARSADFVLGEMRVDGRLRRFYRDGRAAGPAFLEDYAFLIAGLLDLYEVAPDPRWLRESRALQGILDAYYADREGGGYFRGADDQERLLAREKPGQDSAVPSGNGVEALNLLRLAEFTGEARYAEQAALIFSAFHESLTRNPTGSSELLLALDYHLDTPKEIILVRPRAGDGDLGTLLAPLRRSYVPNRVLAVVKQGPELAAHSAQVPMLAGKVARDGRVTAYVCENRVCRFPTTDPAVFSEQIRSVRPLE